MESRFYKLLALSTTLIHFFAFAGLIYRSQLYDYIHITYGDVYEVSDAIGLLFTFIVVVIWCCAFISAVAITLFNTKNNWLFSLKALLYATVALVGYFYIKDSNLIM